jgi:hypothetical protein
VGYELQVFRGEPRADARDDSSFEPLDRDTAVQRLLALDGAGDLGDEVTWPREWFVASVLFSAGEDGKLRSLFVSVDGQNAAPETPDLPEQARWDFRHLLETLLDVADRQRARLYDRQLDRFLDRDGLDEAIAGFGRTAGS